jgi:hypothetical protein
MRRHRFAVVPLIVAFTCSWPGLAAGSESTPAPGWGLRVLPEPTIFNDSDVQDAVEKLVISATGGTYELEPSELSNASAPIAWDASASELQSALEAIPGVGANNIAVTGGPGDAAGDKPYFITWTGALSGTSRGGFTPREEKLINGLGEGTLSRTRIQQPHASDRYLVLANNIGAKASEGEITIEDRLPAGQTVTELAIEESESGLTGECNLKELTCRYSEPLRPGHMLRMSVGVIVPPGSPPQSGEDEAIISGGGAQVVTRTAHSRANEGPPQFGIQTLGFEAVNNDGSSDHQAADHPFSLITSLALNSRLALPFEEVTKPYAVVHEPKNISLEMPLGFLGDPLATPRCPESGVSDRVGGAGHKEGLCPPGSQVGFVHLIWAGGIGSEFFPLYNVVPERGYPAELGFNAVGPPVFIYATVVPVAAGYRLRLGTGGALRAQGVEQIEVTVFGALGERRNGGGGAAFITNPADCSTAPLNMTAEVTGWEGGSDRAETVAYPAITGCNLLQGAAAFDPSISVQPEVEQTDKPTGLHVRLRIPQAPSVFGALATPTLKNATVTLPPGLAISPSAASGPDALQACAAAQIDLLGREVGEGHPGGNGSPYDDGLMHPRRGNCPEASQIGNVKITTPLLDAPLEGHVYLAQPECGAEGQPECTEEAAEDGRIFKLYLEAGGSGVIVKTPGIVEVGGHGAHSRETGLAPGQIRTRFSDAPQFPFEELDLTFTGRERAPLTTPQTCGAFTTTSALTPWSGEEGVAETPSAGFVINGCREPMPFAPGFSGGTAAPLGGAFSPLVTTFTRSDGEQNLGRITVRTPPGLLASLAGVVRCGEAAANAGACPESSRIGKVTVATGAGSQPLFLRGSVYLTDGYRGAAFGLAIVVPAKAGPFDLGNQVVRAAISVDPLTAQITVESDPLPQERDGVPFRLKQVAVTIDRPNFTLNPTNCSSFAMSGTLAGALPDGNSGSVVSVSSPFAVAGCANLPFKPKFTVSTSGKTSKQNGASLLTKLSYPSGSPGSQANIKSVKVALPKALPSRLTTLQKACTAQQFESNPASCPPASIIGHAIVHTPLLPVPLTGPAIFVSHGGEAFPSLIMVLQGYGVTVDLVGTTFINKAGITSTTFKTVPDVPFSTFELTLPQGKFSALASNLPAKANGSFCGQRLVMPSEFTAQNGAVLKQNTPIAVTGCAKKKLTRKQKLAAALKACKRKAKGKREACAKAARRRFGAVKGKGGRKR